MARSAHYFTKFEEGNFYHVYNRAVDRKPLFTNKRNYYYFMSRIEKYIIPYADLYAFCLLGNHFHLLLKIKELQKGLDNDSATLKELPTVELPTVELPTVELPTVELPTVELPTVELPTVELPTVELPTVELPTVELPTVELPTVELPTVELPTVELPTVELPTIKPICQIVSAAFRKMFQSYAMAFNKQEDRIGTLFQEPFKRSWVDTEAYLLQMIYYIHSNPQKHGLVNDFRSYPYSSYSYYLNRTPCPWVHDVMYELLGGYDGFIEFHNNISDDPDKKYRIE